MKSFSLGTGKSFAKLSRIWRGNVLDQSTHDQLTLSQRTRNYSQRAFENCLSEIPKDCAFVRPVFPFGRFESLNYVSVILFARLHDTIRSHDTHQTSFSELRVQSLHSALRIPGTLILSICSHTSSPSIAG